MWNRFNSFVAIETGVALGVRQHNSPSLFVSITGVEALAGQSGKNRKQPLRRMLVFLNSK
jgi:hypothetical protein